MIQMALFAAAIICFLLGLIVFLNNSRELQYKVYFSLSIISALWMIANGISTNTPITVGSSVLLFASRLITPLSLLATLNFMCFTVLFRRVSLPRWSWLLALPTVLVSSLSFTNLNAHLTSSGDVTVGKLYPLYLAVLLFNIVLIFAVLYQRVTRMPRAYASTARIKAQLQYIRLGTYLMFVPAVGFGAVVPLFNGTSTLSNIGPLFALAFLTAAAIAMVKHQLFDIRSVVARSLAYLLSLAAIAAMFIAASYAVTSVISNSIDNTLRLIYSFLALLLALVFPTIKRFFDRNTNRIFYRDAYDSQTFLDEFNKTLVSTYDLAPLLHRSAEIIADNLKASYVMFGIHGPKGSMRKVVAVGAYPKVPRDEAAAVQQSIRKVRARFIIADALGDKHDELRELLREKNAAIVADLSPSGSREESPGYLIIGTKKSGNVYSAQDIRIIEILTNELVIAVQNALRFEEIENFADTLQDRVDEATRKLRRTNEKLKQLDEAKDDFVSMASHQLRTPLTSIKGYTSMVLEGDAGPINDTQRELLQQAFFSSQRMVYLIADLLNVSRLKTGKFVIEPAQVNLAEVVEQEISQLKETAAGRKLTLTYDKPENFPVLTLDETKTRQVIMNFADNAIYYTPAGGHINVILEETPTSVTFKVVDDGIGVPKREQPHLFTKFYRAGNARKARPDGTGLGLFMAKKVIVGEGGAIIFETEEGKGSTFGFTFPKKQRPIVSADAKAA